MDDIDLSALTGAGTILEPDGTVSPAIGILGAPKAISPMAQESMPAPSMLNAGIKENNPSDVWQIAGPGVGLATGFVHGNNTGVNIFRDAWDISDHGDIDPAWRGDNDKQGAWYEWAALNAKDMPSDNWWRFSVAKNQEHAQSILDRYRDDTNAMRELHDNYGIGGVVGSMLAGVVDVDTIAGAMLGNPFGAVAAKYGRVGAAVSAGASAGLLAATDVVVSPTADWRNIPLAAVGGAAFGTLLSRGGKLEPDGLAARANDIAASTERQYAEEIGTPMRDTSSGTVTSKSLDDILSEAGYERAPDEPNGNAASLSAASSGAQVVDYSAIRNPESVKIIQHAEQDNAGNPWISAWGQARVQDIQSAYEKTVNYVKDTVNAVIPNDFARLMNSSSEVAKMYAYRLFADATGTVVNNQNAAQLKDYYKTRMRLAFSPYMDMYNQWAEGVKGYGVFKRAFGEGRDEFDRLVVMEMQARKYGGALSTDPVIKQAADALDKVFELDVKIGQGEAGEIGRKGYDTLTPETGYFPQVMHPKKIDNTIVRLMKQHGINQGAARKMIVDGLAEFWRGAGMNAKDSGIWAEAWVDRAMRRERGVTTSLIELLQEEGGGALAEFLARQPGVSKADAEAIVQRLVGKSEDRGKAGHLKQRMDIDYRAVASNGVAFADLVDMDVVGIVHRRIETGAGMAAVARHGITSKSDFAKIKDAILEEQQALNRNKVPPQGMVEKVQERVHGETDVDDEFLENAFKYFTGEPLSDAKSMLTWSRVRRATQAVFLQQNGMQQIAEYGPIMAAMGARDFVYSLPDHIQQMLSKKDSPLMKELRSIGAYFAEERLHRGTSDFVNDRAAMAEELGGMFDRVLTGGLELQAKFSLQDFIRNSQQRMMTNLFAVRVGQIAKREMNDVFFEARMKEFGMDDDFINLIKRNHKHMEYDKNGDLTSLGTKNWTDKDVEKYVLASNKYRDTHVQRAIEGHSHALFNKDGVWSLLAQFKSYPLQAIMRQTYREAKYGDGQTLAAVYFGSGMAALAYLARQEINLKSDEVDWVDVVKGGVGMSSMLGWMPMIADPVMGSIGFDDLRFANHLRDGQVLNQPASMSAMNNMLRLASVPVDAVTGRMDHNTWMALKATPFVGNMYGVAGALNSLSAFDKARGN